ncbi:MAG: hypothetical protein R2796_00910 [Chitinophagaceae bacterium]
MTLFLLNICKSTSAQVKICGKIYDQNGILPVESASIISTSGQGTLSDSTGSYTLIVNSTDSIWFSYLGKATKKFPVADIKNINDFNVSLFIDIHVLQEVRIRTPDYKQDSIQNRIDYATVFNYKKPTLKSVVPVIGFPNVVIDLDELIRVFQYRKKRLMLSFQKRLVEEEQQKFISHIFTKSLVSKLIGLKGESLDSFMVKQRPSYEFILSASDYTLRKYIKDAYNKISKSLK